MLRFDEEVEVFFDACDESRTSVDSSASEDHGHSDPGLEFRSFGYELWARELMSIQERRSRFLKGTGFDEFVTAAKYCSQDSMEVACDSSSKDWDLERITASNNAVSGSSREEDESAIDGIRCIRDLDSGKRFIVHDVGHMLKEVGSDKLITLQEFEALLGLSRSVQKLLRRELTPKVEKCGTTLDCRKKDKKKWWRILTRSSRRSAGICKCEARVKSSTMNRLIRTRVRQQKKRCMELSALYMVQEIEAHKGAIRAMKFSPSGWYLASGGDDCVVRVWQIREAETFCNSSLKDAKPMHGKCSSSAPLFIPKRVFKIVETPLHELHGHWSGILDLCWSKSDYLLTSSKDKTVRLWKVGSSGSLATFEHKDYVTCVQFNPVDERYFITGSIDGKVRVWGTFENRVVDWVDIHDMVTTVCYRPDGKGFVVGSITGSCCFYDYSGENMQMERQFCVQGKKKSASNLITSMQFSPDNIERVLITSADSKVRIVDGSDVVQKFRGLRRAKSQSSASFTSDGKYIVSAGKDSHVYIWNSDNSSAGTSPKRAKSITSCEFFSSEALSVVAPWPGVDRGQAFNRNNHRPPSSLPQRILDPTTLLRDPDCFSLGAWLCSDGLVRGSVMVTWPEEKLPSSPTSPSSVADNYQHRYRCLAALSAAWNMVIVTASYEGAIRAYHNFGLPVRL